MIAMNAVEVPSSGKGGGGGGGVSKYYYCIMHAHMHLWRLYILDPLVNLI